MYIDFPEVHLTVQGMEHVVIPKMVTVRQKYDADKITDLARHIRFQMENNLENRERFRSRRICLTVGSRGIPHLAQILKTVCDILKEWGAEPFLVPAMGSHGGATAEGQRELLAGYHVTEESIGVPVLSSMEVVRYGELPDGTPLYCDRNAWESDGIVVFNKVKPHTNFRGKHESGMAKMIAIGLAKHKGASMFHMEGFGRFAELIPQIAQIFLEKAPVAFGVGVVQNAYDEICNLEVCEKERLLQKDAELLEIAKRRMPKFKFRDCDVLILDEIGKNISGNGYDPNIVGRNTSEGFPGEFHTQKLFIRGLTRETHHNGSGLAMADISTRRCLNGVDWNPTWVNAVTATVLNAGRIPMYANNDREALLLCIRTCNGIRFDRVRIARARNTLSLDRIQVSETLYEEIRDREDVELIGSPEEMEFDEEGFLL